MGPAFTRLFSRFGRSGAQERKRPTFEKLARFVSRGGSMDPDAVPPDVASFTAGMTLTIGCKECPGAWTPDRARPATPRRHNVFTYMRSYKKHSYVFTDIHTYIQYTADYGDCYIHTKTFVCPYIHTRIYIHTYIQYVCSARLRSAPLGSARLHSAPSAPLGSLGFRSCRREPSQLFPQLTDLYLIRPP